MRDFYPLVGVDYDAHSYEEIARIWLDEFNRKAIGVGLLPGALEAIQRLHAQGRSQSVLSASYEPSLKKQCVRWADPVYADISGLQDESASKKTEIGRRQRMNWGWLARTWCLWVDMLADAHLAEALGADCVLVHGGTTI